jgi:hypothetical protein
MARQGWDLAGAFIVHGLHSLTLVQLPAQSTAGTSTVCACVDRCRCGYLPGKVLNSSFVTLLTDQFHEKYLSGGLAGGQAAADQFMEKVREHLSSLDSAIDDPKTVP